MKDSGQGDSRQAVALIYDHETSKAPRVVAKGRGPVVDELLARAREHDVPLWHDAELAAVLSQLELGDEIPSELYMSVAKVLAFVHQLCAESQSTELHARRIPSQPHRS